MKFATMKKSTIVVMMMMMMMMVVVVKSENPTKFLVEKCPGRRSKEEREALSACARWSLGMEHESMYMHNKNNGNNGMNKKKNEENNGSAEADALEDFVVNVGKVAKQMSLYGRVHGLDRQEHSIAVDLISDKKVELSGRVCSGVNEINFRSMAESVSTDHAENTFDAVFCHVTTTDQMIVDIINADPSVRAMSEQLGPVGLPSSGMSSELGVYTRTRGKTFMCASCGSCDLKDYTGSYHMSISLPTNPNTGLILYDDSTLLDRDTCAPSHTRGFFDIYQTLTTFSSARDEWIKAHANFANIFQWIEPILVATMGAADADAVCDEGMYTEGSYRTGSIGWGVPGTTDVRTFAKVATGRLCPDSSAEWLMELDTAYRNGLQGCVEKGMGSDIRVRSSVDEHLLTDGQRLPPMQLGEGIEIRVFDNFPHQYMPQVYRLIAMLAEASRLHHAPHYIYDDHNWKIAMQQVMKEGWNAILPQEYIFSLEQALDIQLRPQLAANTQAFAVFKAVYTAIWDKHSKGFWTNLLLDDLPEQMPDIACPNRQTWEMGAVNAGITKAEILRLLDLEHLANNNNDNNSADDARITVESLNQMGAGGCQEDIEDLIYLAEKYKMIGDIAFNDNGSIHSFQFGKRHLQEGSNDIQRPICRFKDAGASPFALQS